MAVNWVGNKQVGLNSLGNVDYASLNNSSNSGTERSVDVYQPEQWDAFRQFQTGAAYDPSVLQRYLSDVIDPNYQRIIDTSVRQANNQYGATPSGYFSAATLQAKNQAQTEGEIAGASERAKAAIQWDQAKKEAQMRMLDQRPIEKSYIPEPAKFNPSMYGGGQTNTVIGNPGSTPNYDMFGKGDLSKAMGWNETTPYSGGYTAPSSGASLYSYLPTTSRLSGLTTQPWG
jgi:hypothetical protein